MEVREESPQVSVRGRWRLCVCLGLQEMEEMRDANVCWGQPMDRDRVAATID